MKIIDSTEHFEQKKHISIYEAKEGVLIAEGSYTDMKEVEKAKQQLKIQFPNYNFMETKDGSGNYYIISGTREIEDKKKAVWSSESEHTKETYICYDINHEKLRDLKTLTIIMPLLDGLSQEEQKRTINYLRERYV